MFFAARTFAMKLGQSIAMLAFTSLAIIGTNTSREELMKSNDITASSFGLMIVGITAVVFCVLGAVILMFYDEQKVMKSIAKDSDKDFLDAIEEK
jgi:GPH family glycoside/pentoside/hexuronide:cation symporter